MTHARFSDFDPSTLVPLVGGFLSQAAINNFATIEIRTAISPPVVMNVADLLNSKAPPSPVTQFLQPTVILTDRSGKKNVIAPYGVTEGGASGLLALVALFGGVFLLGRLSTRLF